MVGRPRGSTKDADRKRVQNPNGRLIDFEGSQYMKLLKRGYKLNTDETRLIEDENFTGDRNALLHRGRPRGRTSPVLAVEKVKNPDTGRLIIKNKLTFNKLIKKYNFNESNNKFITKIFDEKRKINIKINSSKFKKRVKTGYIHDKINSKLTKPSVLSEAAFKNAITTHSLTIVEKIDPITQINKLDMRIKYILTKELNKRGSLKILTSMEISFLKPIPTINGDLLLNTTHLHAKAITINNKDEIKEAVNKQNSSILAKIDRFTNGGSGWTINEIQRHYITILNNRPLAAKSYIPLPQWIQNKKATINIKNKDDKCFIYCLARCLDLHPEKRKA